MAEVKANDYVDPDGLIVGSGELLAQKAVDLLRSGESVRVQLRGLSGISSSYFNVFLRRVRDAVGIEHLQRVEFVFVSPLQQQVYDRSLQALKDEQASPGATVSHP